MFGMFFYWIYEIWEILATLTDILDMPQKKEEEKNIYAGVGKKILWGDNK